MDFEDNPKGNETKKNMNKNLQRLEALLTEAQSLVKTLRNDKDFNDEEQASSVITSTASCERLQSSSLLTIKREPSIDKISSMIDEAYNLTPGKSLASTPAIFPDQDDDALPSTFDSLSVSLNDSRRIHGHSDLSKRPSPKSFDLGDEKRNLGAKPRSHLPMTNAVQSKSEDPSSPLLYSERDGKETVELIEGTKIYISETDLWWITNNAKKQTTMAIQLMEAIFKPDALQQCNFLKQKPRGRGTTEDVDLHQKAIQILIEYVQKWAAAKGWSHVEDRKIIESLRYKLNKIKNPDIK